MARTSPATWFEIKAVADLDYFLYDEKIAAEVRRRLRVINEPYVLTLQPSSVKLAQVPTAVREIRRLLREHHRTGGNLPQNFEARGLRIEARATRSRTTGYLGTTMFPMTIWGDEVGNKVRDRIISAVGQLPDDVAGVVVIDRTTSNTTEDDDLLTACFGPHVIGFHPSIGVVNVRDESKGAFQPGQRTRVSAVAAYSRHARLGGPYEFYVVHNPFAAIVLDDALFAGDFVRQVRREALDGGRFRLVSTPPEEETTDGSEAD